MLAIFRLSTSYNLAVIVRNCMLLMQKTHCSGPEVNFFFMLISRKIALKAYLSLKKKLNFLIIYTYEHLKFHDQLS